MDLEEIKREVNSNKATLVDVREHDELPRHPKAIHIPYSEVSKDMQLPKKPLILFCRSGRRAHIVQKLLQKLGYEATSIEYTIEDLLD